MNKPVIFLDRDGTINDDPGYLSQPKDFILLPKVIEALQQLQKLGFDLIIITNQSGIGRGFFNQENLNQVHLFMLDIFTQHNITIKNIYVCPHSPQENCICRKPKTGLIDKACAENKIDMQNSWMVGDKIADIELGINCGLKTAQIIGKYPLHQKANYKVKNLLNFVQIITIDKI